MMLPQPEERRRIVPPFEFQTEELADAFTQIIFSIHEQIGSTGTCFRSDVSAARRREVLGQIRTIVNCAFAESFGCRPSDRFGDIFDQASYLASHLALDHIFPDGNKRTALIAALLLVRLTSVKLDIEDDPDPRKNIMYGWIEDVVSRGKSEGELAQELRRRAFFQDDEERPYR